MEFEPVAARHRAKTGPRPQVEQSERLMLDSDPAHPALASFPTDFHSDYQWRELLEGSKAFVLDDAPKAYRPVIQVIDDYHRNHKLAALFEMRVAPGRLRACGMNLTDTGASRPVARQMLHNLVEYARSERFAPATELDGALLERLLGGGWRVGSDG